MLLSQSNPKIGKGRVPGLVVALPRLSYWIRIGFRSLSMVGGEIFSKALVTSGESSPKHATYPNSQVGSMAFSRFEQGKSALSQISLRGLRMASF